ncbi:MAG TPA: hypothetical protein VN602_13785 [Gemmatimonadaceae bacterium]|nr:hypothetical protein [Gemmatimonadaceae bacterium]
MKSSATIGALTLAACVACLACASGGAGTSSDIGQATDVKQVQMGATSVDFIPNSPTPLAWHNIEAPATTTWQYLPIAYSKLGLRITKYDSTTHVIAGERDRSHSDFGGKPLTSLIECGDVAGIPNASRFDVTIQVTSALRGSEKSSAVASVASASAKANGTSGDPAPCTVNAGIGNQVAAAVAQAVKDGTK